MALPISPIIPGLERKEIRLKSDADDIRGLPCLRLADPQGTVLLRFALSWGDIWAILRGATRKGGSLWIAQRTYWEPFQPIAVLAAQPRVGIDELTPGTGGTSQVRQAGDAASEWEG